MSMRPKRILAVTGVAAAVSFGLLLLYDPVDAVSTRSFDIDDAAAFAAGEMEGTAAHSDGSVTTSAEVRRIALDDVATAWTFARARDGVVYIGTGNEGKLYQLRGDAITELADTEQLLVSALAVGDRGALYAGTLPEGKVYRVDPGGQVTELVDLDDADHVWELVWDAQRRRLFAATGPNGKVFAIDPARGTAEIYWDSEAAHVMSLALDGDGSLYAGTSDEALVVRLRGPGRAEVVHDFPGNEVTAIAVRDGRLAVAANEFPDPPAVAGSTKTKSSAFPPRPQKGKGRLFRVQSDGRTERVYAQDDGHFTSVQMADDGTIWAGAGKDGRVHRVAPDGAHAVWIDVDERQVLDIDLLGTAPMFVTGDAGAVYRIVPGRPRDGTWTSKVLDARFVSRFGQLTWRGNGAITFQTRSGNVEEPDDTWSAWSTAIGTPGPIRSDAARFLQLRARFPQGADARLFAVTAYYLPQNQRSRVSNVRLKVDPEKAKNKNKNKNRSPEDPPPPTTEYELTWDVSNPDSDRLRYRLQYRQEGQTVWRDILRESEELTADEYKWETNGLPDGWYVVQVIATDELSNPGGQVTRDTSASEPLLIDNHPPRIEQLRAQGTRITGRAIDGLGPIAKLEHAIDGREWRMFYPADDLFDTAEERFDVDVGPLERGPHVVAVRATDAGGNTVSEEVQITVR
jgi:sugar lactone lactonase YvrE